MIELAKFRQRYPQGSLVGELVDIDRGTYIVRVSIQVENIVLATGLAAAERVETAEDTARSRAIAALVLDNSSTIVEANSTPKIETQAADKVADLTPVLDSSTKAIEIEPSGANFNNGSGENKNIINLADYPTEKTTPIDATNDKKEPTSSTKSQPQPTPKPEADEALMPDQLVTTPDNSTKNSGNLFEGTQQTETTVEQLLEEGAEISASDSNSPASSDNLEERNFIEIKQKTDIEIKRLGWTRDDGREFLKSRYGKRSRLHLTDEQLLEFLHYLENQPTPS